MHGATLADLLAVADEKPYYELIDGALSQKGGGDFVHGDTQVTLGARLPRRGSQDDPREPWWIGMEVHVALGSDVVVPDLAGWRCDRVPEPPPGFPVTIRPDWICEIVTPASSRDTILKLRVYHRAGVPHYWLADPYHCSLTVLRWQPEGYLVVLAAEPPAHVRPEPFEAVEYSVAELLGVDK